MASAKDFWSKIPSLVKLIQERNRVQPGPIPEAKPEPPPEAQTAPAPSPDTIEGKIKALNDAIARHLSVQILYDGMIRLVEPYEVKSNPGWASGAIYLYAMCDTHKATSGRAKNQRRKQHALDDGGKTTGKRIHSFRLDKIAYMNVTNIPFTMIQFQ